jgi:hypothetical protein
MTEDHGPSPALPEPAEALTEPVTDLLAAFHAKVALGASRIESERVDFAVGSTVAPTDQQGNFTTVFVLTIAIPSVLIGQMIHTVVLVPNLWATEDNVAEQVRLMVESLREDRAKMAAEAQNGRIPPTG